MNQKTILGLTAILALTIVIVSGFYFFSTKSSVQKPVQTTAATSDMPVSEAAASEGIPAAEVDGIDVEELTAGIKQPSSEQNQPKLLNFELDQSLKAIARLKKRVAGCDWNAVAPGLQVTFSTGLTTNAIKDTADIMLARATSA